MNSANGSDSSNQKSGKVFKVTERFDSMNLGSQKGNHKSNFEHMSANHGSFNLNTQQKGSNAMVKDRASSFQGKELVNKMDRFDKQNAKGAKKKGKKGFKWNKPGGCEDLLGFDQYGTSPFDHDNGYDINDVDLIHFRERPVKKKTLKSTNFSACDHVQANHRFILKPNRNQDYFFATYDPDYVVEWNDIFMVQAKRNTEYLCPICRDEKMVVPVINKCGHIYCWPCILHYLLYSNEAEGEDWRKCPLCEELVFKKSLRFAKVLIKPPPKENEKRTFKLAFRNKASSVVKYYEETDEGKEERPKYKNLEVLFSDSEAYNLTRIRVCVEYNLIFEDLKSQLVEDCKEAKSFGDTLRISLCHEALEAINLLEANIKKELEFVHQQLATKVNNMDEIDQSDNSEEHPKIEKDASENYKELGIYNCLAQTEKRQKYDQLVKEAEGSYYFYQLDDDTNSFLDPL